MVTQVMVELYTVDELDATVREKVIEHYRNMVLSVEIPFLEESMDYRLDELLVEHKLHVIKDQKLYYSLSNSQGDGVCFTGVFKWNCYTVYIKHSGHYNHHNSKEVIIETGYYNDAKQVVYDAFEKLYTIICKELEV